MKRTWAIGGHDWATILGVSPYKTITQLWGEKTGQIPKPDLSGVPAVQRGHVLEPHLLKLYGHETGRVVTASPPYPNNVMQHAEFPWAIAPLDGKWVDPLDQGKKGLLDAKSVTRFKREDWQPVVYDERRLGDRRQEDIAVEVERRLVDRRNGGVPRPTAGHVPLEANIQMQSYLWVARTYDMCKDISVGSFAVGIVNDDTFRSAGDYLIGLEQFLWCDVEYNDDFIQAVLPRIEEFVKCVEDGVRPPAELDARDYSYYSALLGQETDETIALDERAERLVAMCHAAQMKSDIASDELKVAKMELMDLMGSAAVGVLPNGRKVHFKTEKDRDEVMRIIPARKGQRVLRLPRRS